MPLPQLPTPEEFAAQAGINGIGSPQKTKGRGEIAIPGVSKEFRALIVDYCAAMIQAHELGQVDWRGLAQRLGTKPEFLAEAAAAMDQHLSQNGGGGIWQEVLAARIQKAQAAKIFRDNSWEQLERIAVSRLVTMATAGLIRDPGELLAVATQARRVTEGPSSSGAGSGNQLNVTINQGSGAESMNGELPPAGAKMTIDLSPRVATSLQQRKAEVAPVGERVIDGDMISAKELREFAAGTDGAAEGDSE